MSFTSDYAIGSKTLVLFKSDLEQQRNELLDALQKHHQEIRALADSGPRDVIDESCSNSWAEAIFASYSQSRAQLRKVEAALRRITAGEFGLCDICEGAIELKRLKALPWAHTCIECQQRSEQSSIH